VENESRTLGGVEPRCQGQTGRRTVPEYTLKMKINLLQLEQRIKELELLADEVGTLAENLTKDRNAQPDLSTKGQAWFRGARELLVQQKFSGLGEFDAEPA
jgi:hypothetical protein